MEVEQGARGKIISHAFSAWAWPAWWGERWPNPAGMSEMPRSRGAARQLAQADQGKREEI
jgi:hypothetical protein